MLRGIAVKMRILVVLALSMLMGWSSVGVAMDGAAAAVREGEIAAMPLFNERSLQTIAEREGYGYKTANLLVLSELVAWFSRVHDGKIFPVRVPEFFGIASGRIEQLLREHGFNIAMKWQEVLETIPADGR